MTKLGTQEVIINRYVICSQKLTTLDISTPSNQTQQIREELCDSKSLRWLIIFDIAYNKVRFVVKN
jgi:hypothetical protein